MTIKTPPDFRYIPDDDFAGDPPRADIPVTVRQRLNWSDVDAAQIGYTARQMALAIDAIEIWWEQVLTSNYWILRQQGRGSPSVKAEIEFFVPVGPGDRTDNQVFVEKLGNSSMVLRVEGYNQSGQHCYTARQTAVQVEGVPEAPKPRLFDDQQRQRIEGYMRECDLQSEGVKNKRQVLDYWFAPVGSPERGENRDHWFGSGDVDVARIDQEIRDQFASTHSAALGGNLDHWQLTPMGVLALTLVLDQFPRNLFRGSSEAFSSDDKALAVSRAAIAAGHHEKMGGQARRFLFLPFEHAENLSVQKESILHFKSLADTPIGEECEKYAQQHLDIIEKFGRFPHRNAVLERESTPEELEFLEDEDVHFGQNK